MASPFDVAMRAADVGIATTFGELIKVTPRVALARHGPVVDIDRDEKTVRGVFTITGGMGQLANQAGGGRQIPGLTFLSQAESIVWFPRVSMEELGYDFHKDDEVCLIERPGEPRYSVIQDYPSGQQDIVLHLALLTEPPQ